MAIYNLRQVERQAKKHARSWRWVCWPFWKMSKEPRPEQGRTEPCEFEKQLKEGAQCDIQTLSQKWEEDDHKLKPAFAKQIAQVRNLEERYPRESEEETRAKKAYEEAAANYRELLPPGLRAGWMYFLLVFLGVVEFPINTIVFSILADTPIWTYVFALAILVIPLCAHFVGQALKQEDKTPTDRAFLIIVPTIILACLFGFGFLRGQYLAAVLLKMKTLGIAIGPTMATAIFLAFNAAIFSVAVFVSYSGAHPQHRLYRQRRLEVKEARKRHEKELSKANETAQRLFEARLALAEMKHQREKRWRWYGEKAEALRATAKHYIVTYRGKNMEWRSWAEPPECFKKPPLDPDIPIVLRTLDWTFDTLAVSL